MRRNVVLKSQGGGVGSLAVGKEVVARILLVDDDAMLAADAADLGFPALAVQTAVSVAELELQLRRSCDVVVISLDVEGGFEALEKLCGLHGSPPVIAIAGRSQRGLSLEHRLTLAELRGAALSLPKPIDASELALAAVQLLSRRRDDQRLAPLADELEKLALY